MGDGFLGANFDARSTEDATTEIERDAFSRFAGDGLRGTGRHAGGAAICTIGGIDFERAAVTVGQGRYRTFGVGHGLAAAFEAMKQSVVDEHGVVVS